MYRTVIELKKEIEPNMLEKLKISHPSITTTEPVKLIIAVPIPSF